MRQNMVFSTKNTKNFLGRGHSSLPIPFPQWEGHNLSSTPHPLGARGISTPRILKSWICGTPLAYVVPLGLQNMGPLLSAEEGGCF